ncbi:Bacitracin export permease protein BceB [Candidatus Nanosyncoccus nanoralicus]|uniref:Bacitracin export permease protein BceB n=2 Tax=Candidatus Nanosyncoccus nanoralicus TaxID=2171996 RepID=A0ABY0FKE0_9BACT|nr:Bacitracin export permease protein BceB [Candidatus Nanosyncoccus nanoralicus]
MLFKLSFRNIIRSMKDYAIYFFTLVLGVVIFYVFNVIGTQTSMMELGSSTKDVVKLLVNVLSGVSLIVDGILGYLIIYASRFLIKRRNKEFSIYLTLGMSKRKISLLLFLETLFIGLLSLVAGLSLGIILSQLMSVMVANLFEADMSKFQFVFSGEACLKTIAYFGIIYLLVIAFNTVMINKLKIIDLIQASRKSEKVRLKNPIICTVIFFLAATILGVAYYQVTVNYLKVLSEIALFWQVIGAGVIATFLLYWSLSGLIMKLIVTRKKLYYKDLNSFTFKQISSKINTTVASMSIICLMLFITICTLSSCLSIRETSKKQLEYATPVDAVVSYRNNYNSRWEESNSEEEKDSPAVKAWKQEMAVRNENDSRATIEDIIKTSSRLWNNLKDQTSFDTYILSKKIEDGGLDLNAVLNQKSLQKIAEMTNGHANGMYVLRIISVSDYNKIANLYHFDQYKLNPDQYFILSDFKKMEEIYNISLKDGHKIKINGKTLSPKFDHNKQGFIEPSNTNGNMGILVVSDEVTKTLVKYENFMAANYKTNDKNKNEQLDKDLRRIITGNENDYIKITSPRFYNIQTKNQIIAMSVGLQAIAVFLGLYLGIIFLISSAAILSLKELSESSDNREKYMTLRRLGVDERMINRALFRQIAIFFAAPLFLAIIHSIFGLTFAIKILSFIGTDGLAPSIVMAVIFLVTIYGGYFLLTYLSSKRIISEKQLRRD